MELRDEVLEKIIQRAAVLFKKDPGELSPDTKWVEDLKAKSVNYVQVIAVLEDALTSRSISWSSGGKRPWRGR